ncbi:hypothetical protein [Neobacillus terrae]|uniref:hypothetical protein n=1 Tax=Neobacillus terrae TaxID=3034837 RepID=UPI00140A7235|nr:hypothetical protein [Neobacillus terrae]NHM33828.1 hypothetical protein [Neobacillus terrae]
MNPDMRFYMHHHFGTGYMPCPFYGGNMGYAAPSYVMGYYHHSHNPYYKWTHQHMKFPSFAVPFV